MYCILLNCIAVLLLVNVLSVLAGLPKATVTVSISKLLLVELRKIIAFSYTL